MATVDAIIARVERRVIDLPTAVSTEVSDLVEKAHRELQDRHNFRIMRAVSASLPTTVDTSTLAAIPSDFKSYRGRPYYTDDLGDTFRLWISQDKEEVLSAFSIAATDIGDPRVLLETEDETWEVYPIADGLANTTDGEYPIVVPYWKYLTFPSSTDWFTVNADWFLTFWATAEAFMVDWDEQHAAVWFSRAENEYRKLLKVDARRRAGHVETMVPHKDVYDTRMGF